MGLRLTTSEDVKLIFNYSDGKLFWRSDRGFKIKSGDEAGSLDYKGYKQVKVGKYVYKMHRLIFLYHHGYLPEIIDHINNDKTDNRIQNLRAATPSESQCNRLIQSNNTSGSKGVSWCGKRKRWSAYCYNNKKKKNLGRFKTKEEAEYVVRKFRESAHGEFANHG